MEYLIQGTPIYTLSENPAATVAESMVVEDEIVKRVGSRKELAADHPGAKTVDVEGGAIIPSFNDSHVHLVHLGQELVHANLRRCVSKDEIHATLKQWADRNPDEDWIIGDAYNQNQLPGSRHLTRYDLDEMFPDKPVFLGHVSGHASVANSRALEKAGVTPDTADPSDGVIERDESGTPTGLLLENAKRIVEDILPIPSNEKLAMAIKSACDHLAGMGILVASDAFTGWRYGLEKECTAYARALELGAPLRLTLMPDVEVSFAGGWEDRSKATLPVAHPELRLGAIKILSDGALTSRTAALLEPFMDTGSKGILIFDPETMVDLIVRSHVGGWQVAVHAIGDYAIQLCLDGFEKAQKLSPRNDCRHRIEHCMVMNEELMQRMAACKAIACAQPQFLYALGNAYKQGLGKRADVLMPYRSWAEMGIPAAFSSDNPVTTGDPILGWRAAVDRTGSDGCQYGPGECLSPMEALKCYTVGSAHATFDDAVGRLVPGMQARFTVISHKPDDILNVDMKVLNTSHELLK